MHTANLAEKARLGRTEALARLKSNRARTQSLAMFCTIRDTPNQVDEHIADTRHDAEMIDQILMAA